jgi:hypothetical protein
VIQLYLEDGRSLLVSPGHPLVDGRTIAHLQPGDVLDGARVRSTRWLSYEGRATYDLLPTGGTGHYWANGILVGSTLARAGTRHEFTPMFRVLHRSCDR